MSDIRVKTVEQHLVTTEKPDIFSGDVNSDRLIVDFDDTWTNYTKTAVFYVTENEVYRQVLTNNYCYIPQEVMKKNGSFYFGVMGVNGTTVLTSEALKYKVGQGAITSDLKEADPTPDIYAQILGKYDEVIKLADAWDKKVDPAIQDAIAAKNQCLDAVAALNAEIYDMDGGDPYTSSYSDDINGGYPS